MLCAMAHHVITIDGPIRLVPERDASERRLRITRDDGEQRIVSVVLSGQSSDLDLQGVNQADAWRAAVFYAVGELEVSFMGDAWGVDPEEGAALVVEAPGPAIARFVGDASAGIALDDGAVVGEFGI
jgi:hypothetical protein